MKSTGFLKDMGAPARAGLFAGVLVIIACAAAALWWLFAPDYQLLFGNLREGDAAEISASLKDWKIPYRFADGGRAIEVPADQVYEMRMKLVSAGVPSGGHVGFELFNDSDFGVTEFAQRVNFQRAVQGELERSIGTLPGVQSVRVHLTIRRPGLFVGQDDSSKASVVVGLAPGETLNPQQVRGIRNLVASAVDGLSPAAVVVLGPDGALQGGSPQGDGSLLDQNSEQAALEARIREQVSSLLNSLFKLRDFRVTVNVQLNFDQLHRVSERLIPQGTDGNGLVTRKQTARTGSATGNTDEKPATSSQETADYSHGSEREELVRAPGQIERISVAVLVPSTMSSYDLGRLTRLIGVAAGLDPDRGDQLEITPMAQLDDARENPVSAEPASLEGEEPVEAPPPAKAKPVKWDMPPALWLVLVGAVCLVLGWWLRWVTQPPPKRHRPAERDAILAKMRAWLAEGGDAA